MPHPSHPSSFVVLLLLLLALALAPILALTCSILVALASGVSYAATTQGLWWSSSATMKFAAMQARESCTVGASRGVRRELPQPRAREALGISLVSPWRRRMALCPWTTVERMVGRHLLFSPTPKRQKPTHCARQRRRPTRRGARRRETPGEGGRRPARAHRHHGAYGIGLSACSHHYLLFLGFFLAV